MDTKKYLDVLYPNSEEINDTEYEEDKAFLEKYF